MSATAARGAGLADGMVSAGLAGYNGALVGRAFSVFLGQRPPTAAATVLPAARRQPPAALKPAMGDTPQWTLSFNVCTLAALASVRPIAAAAAALTLPPRRRRRRRRRLTWAPWRGSARRSWASGFVVESPPARLLLGAVGYYCAARRCTCCWIGVRHRGGGGDGPACLLAAGLHGYNPALTSLAVSVFFVDSTATRASSAGGAAATVGLASGMATAMGGAFGVPALTLPFCAVASGCHLLRGGVIPGLVLAAEPHSPERNEA